MPYADPRAVRAQHLPNCTTPPIPNSAGSTVCESGLLRLDGKSAHIRPATFPPDYRRRGATPMMRLNAVAKCWADENP